MIKNFEEHTFELTDEETNFIPILIKTFETRYKNNQPPIKAPDIIRGLNDYCQRNKIDMKFSEVRLRKMVNHIRTNSLLPLIATSKGYFISYDFKIVEDQVQSLYQRAASIKKCADGLLKFT
mgnify:FL=1